VVLKQYLKPSPHLELFVFNVLHFNTDPGFIGINELNCSVPQFLLLSSERRKQFIIGPKGIRRIFFHLSWGGMSMSLTWMMGM
jgi:hypothetical protein